MISLVKREDYSSEEEYQKALRQQNEAIEFHFKCTKGKINLFEEDDIQDSENK